MYLTPTGYLYLQRKLNTLRVDEYLQLVNIV